ncbi:MAG: molybdenum ABC transporter ATP-binding protein [Betaproteobacteria bacterium]|nr:molybdenum ABC transporter ATP-binding protein [Betaproteobacteria bacterium]
MSTELQLRLHWQRPGFSLQAQLNLPAQGVSVLWGASGSGKTTLLRCVAGLERAQGHVQLGTAVWQDESSGRFVPPWQRRLGMVFQEAGLFQHLDVQGNLDYGLRRLPRSEQAAARRAQAQAIEVLGIGPLLHRTPALLSGGERQRVAIARALSTQPRLLLLDEPLASLDGPRKREVLPWLEALRQHLQVPMLYVTHSADEVAQLADTLVVLEQGQVRACGPVAQVLASVDLPVHLGDDVGALVSGTVAGHDARWGLSRLALPQGELWVGQVPAPMGTPLRLRVLARDVSITLARAEHTSIQNHLPCTVAQIAPDASTHQVLVRLDAAGTPILARLTARAAEQLQLRPGLAVWAQIKAVSLVR